jgi:hypothetical protein
MSTPVDFLKNLSFKAKNALRAAGITTLEEACGLTDTELLALEGMGKASVARLRDWEEDKPEKPVDKGERAALRRDLYRDALVSRDMTPEEARKFADLAVEVYFDGEEAS